MKIFNPISERSFSIGTPIIGLGLFIHCGVGDIRSIWYSDIKLILPYHYAVKAIKIIVKWNRITFWCSLLHYSGWLRFCLCWRTCRGWRACYYWCPCCCWCPCCDCVPAITMSLLLIDSLNNATLSFHVLVTIKYTTLITYWWYYIQYTIVLCDLCNKL